MPGSAQNKTRMVPPANVMAWVVKGDIRPLTRVDATLKTAQQQAAVRQKRFPFRLPNSSRPVDRTKSTTPVQAMRDPAAIRNERRSQPRRTTRSIEASGETETMSAAAKLLEKARPIA